MALAVEAPWVPVFRPELALLEQGGYMEKRRLFLQSYHFSRKRTALERVRPSVVRVRRLVWVRLRAARRLPRMLWSRLKRGWAPRLLWSRLRCAGLSGRGRRRFHRLVVQPSPLPRRSTSSDCWSW